MNTTIRITKVTTIISFCLPLLALMSGTALAEPPSNDIFTGAKAAVIGFTEVLDTTEATTDTDDTQLNAQCGAPATDASVWYAFTTASDSTVVVDVSQSNYSAGVLVGVGNQGNLTIVNCGQGAVAFFAAAGTTYYVLAIDDQINDGGGNGGSLSISFNAVVAPTVDINVNRFGRVNARTGIATISGTYTCSNGDYFSASVDARQNVGRFTISGYGSFFESGTCDEAPRPWSAEIFPSNGKFAGGKAMTVTFGYTCGIFQCADGYIQKTVQLRGGPTK